MSQSPSCLQLVRYTADAGISHLTCPATALMQRGVRRTEQHVCRVASAPSEMGLEAGLSGRVGIIFCYAPCLPELQLMRLSVKNEEADSQ